MAAANIKLGSTLYSFTNEFHDRTETLASLVRAVEERRLGPGIEVVGFQSFRSFPDVSDAEADAFNEMMAGTSLEKVCLGINADRFMRPGVPVSDDEMVAYHERQLQSAAKLGFPVVRYQHTATPAVIRRLVPLAEKLDVKLGLEIHAPHSPGHPDILAYREMYEQVGSAHLGFIPDFGATARAVHPDHLHYFRNELGVDPRAIDKALEIWHTDMPVFERKNVFLHWAKTSDVDERLALELMIIFGIINREDPRCWSEIMHQVIHIHGKFYGVDPVTGEDPSIDYETTLKVFIEGGYNGYISSEWEGHMVSSANGIAKVEAHHAMLRDILARHC